MQVDRSRAAIAMALWVAVATTAARAAPLDLADRTPRWIQVRFEMSPEDAPGRLDRQWSPALPAWLEPEGPEGAIQIRVPSAEIEAHLRARGTEVVPGSFSEFVWTFEPTTGHVLQAELDGRVREPLAMGLIRTTAEVDIRVEMTTRRRAGFRPESRFLGQRTHGFCRGPDDAPDCTLVPARPLDPHSGYVNAIGSVAARIPLAEIRAFSPLGEARFSERDDRGGTEAVATGTTPADAVCLVAFGGSCGPDLGGES